jgi:hypothetical protein
MILEELGISVQSIILLAFTILLLFWLIRYAERVRRDVQDNRAVLEEDMKELESAAKKIEADIDKIYSQIETKVDQTQLELKLEEIEKKRAQLIQGALSQKKKAQASVEIMALFTLLLIATVAGFVYAYSSVSDSLKFTTDIAMDRLASTAERLYVEGPGATASVSVNLPSSADALSSYIGGPTGGEGHYVLLNISGGQTFRLLDATVAGSWPVTTQGKVRPGIAQFNLTVNSSGCVLITPR